MTVPKKLTVNLDHLEKKPRHQENRKMDTRPIKQVTILFTDGNSLEFDVPESQGFYRERYTYTQEETQHGNRITGKLYVHEIIWTLREDQINGNHNGKSKTSK
jgi:hypothetical protein